jgi:hypothetical protein
MPYETPELLAGNRAIQLVSFYRTLAGRHDAGTETVRDIIADLMHYCRDGANGLDFEHEMAMARQFFSDETSRPGKDRMSDADQLRLAVQAHCDKLDAIAKRLNEAIETRMMARLARYPPRLYPSGEQPSCNGDLFIIAAR